MRIRVGLVSLLAFIGLWVGFGRSDAQPTDHHEETAEHHDESGSAEHHEATPAEHHDDKAAEHHEATPAEHEAAPAEHHDDKAAEHHDDKAAEHHDDHAAGGEHHDDHATAGGEHHADADADAATNEAIDEDGVPTHEFDLEGTGHDDPQLKKEYEDAFAGIKENIDTEAVDKELEERLKEGKALDASPADIEKFRKAVAMARKVVLGKMEKKIEAGIEKKMGQFSLFVFLFSLCGIFLLAIPLVVGKKYPGKQGILFKYSAFAAITFFVTVNLFGGVLMGMRTVQGHLGKFANPSLAIAAGTFDTLDTNAEMYATLGKELFLPTLEQLRANEEQPSAILMENGQKLVKDAMVFVSIAKMVKRVDWVFKMIPLILFGLTMILFAKAIKPTLTEIIKLPMRAASGESGVGSDVAKRSFKRVVGELKATLVTIGALVVITVVSAFVLGEICAPVLDTLINYFYLAVNYLLFVQGSSSGLVFIALMGVVFFLALNLATLIISSVFFLGKVQKIFQARYCDDVPVSEHKHFFKWGIPAVLFVQVFPWIFMLGADKLLDKIYESILTVPENATSLSDAMQTWSWGKIFLVAPIVLIVGYGLLFWAARGVKAVAFLMRYKVKPPVAPPVAPSQPAEAV
jgi:hypothetical protein